MKENKSKYEEVLSKYNTKLDDAKVEKRDEPSPRRVKVSR